MGSLFHESIRVEPSAGTLFLCCATMIAAVMGIRYLLWRMSGDSRARYTPYGGSETRMRSPAPALPNWCGFIGGHTLVMKPSKIVEQLHGWAEEFGGDYELQLFGARVIVVISLEELTQILALRPSKFKRGLASDQLRWAAQQAQLGPSMVFSEGMEWRRSRRLISPHLNGHNVTVLLPSISKVAERLCAKLGAHADAGEVVEARDAFARYTHDIIALAALGVDVDSTSARQGQPCPSFDASAKAMDLLMSLTLDPMSILGWSTLSSLLPWVRRAKEHSRRLSNVVQGAIDAAKRDANQSGVRGVSTREGESTPMDTPKEGLAGGTLLRKIVRVAKGKGDHDRTTLSDYEVLREANGLMVAGTENTALTLCWSMYYLAKHPEAFERCRAEALQAAPSSDGLVCAREELSQLKFCSAVFREAVRLKTPAPLQIVQSMGDFICSGFGGQNAIRETLKDDYTMKSGVEVKKGTSFCVLSRPASTSDEYFKRAAEFVPERWIEAERDGVLLGREVRGCTRSALHTETALLSFGAGPRICPGQDLANMEGCAVIAMICARFDISLAPGQPDPPQEIMSASYGPETTKLSFTRRQE